MHLCPLIAVVVELEKSKSSYAVYDAECEWNITQPSLLLNTTERILSLDISVMPGIYSS